jgi:hypothetical protein
MTHFVAFTRGERTGARVGFHTVPVLRSSEYVLPEQGQVVWDWLQIGDAVRVIT